MGQKTSNDGPAGGGCGFGDMIKIIPVIQQTKFHQRRITTQFQNAKVKMRAKTMSLIRNRNFFFLGKKHFLLEVINI